MTFLLKLYLENNRAVAPFGVAINTRTVGAIISSTVVFKIL